MRNSAQIKKELDAANARIADLRPQFDEMSAAFDAAEKAFIAKKIGFAGLQEAETNRSLIERSVNSLLSTAGKLSEDYDAAVKAEARQTAMNALKGTIESAGKAFDEYKAQRQRFNGEARKTAESKQYFRSHRDALATIIREINPNTGDLTGDLRFLAKGERDALKMIFAELESSGLSKASIDLIVASNPELPPIEHARAIEVAENTHFAAMAESARLEQQQKLRAARQKGSLVKAEQERILREEQEAKAKHQQRWVGGNRAATA